MVHCLRLFPGPAGTEYNPHCNSFNGIACEQWSGCYESLHFSVGKRKLMRAIRWLMHCVVVLIVVAGVPAYSQIPQWAHSHQHVHYPASEFILGVGSGIGEQADETAKRLAQSDIASQVRIKLQPKIKNVQQAFIPNCGFMWQWTHRSSFLFLKYVTYQAGPAGFLPQLTWNGSWGICGSKTAMHVSTEVDPLSGAIYARNPYNSKHFANNFIGQHLRSLCRLKKVSYFAVFGITLLRLLGLCFSSFL